MHITTSTAAHTTLTAVPSGSPANTGADGSSSRYITFTTRA